MKRMYAALPKGSYVMLNFGKTTKGRPSKVRLTAWISDETRPLYVDGDSIADAAAWLALELEKREGQ